MINFDESKALVDVILSNGLLDIRFAPFPDTAMSSKKNTRFLPPPPPPYPKNERMNEWMDGWMDG